MGIEKFAVIGRPPTQEQVDFAAERGIVLVPIGDADLFWVDRKWVWDRCHGADGVVVSHAGAALRLLHHGRTSVYLVRIGGYVNHGQIVVFCL